MPSDPYDSGLGLLFLCALGMSVILYFSPDVEAHIPINVSLCVITVSVTVFARRMALNRISWLESMSDSTQPKKRLCVDVCAFAILLVIAYMMVVASLDLPLSDYFPIAVINSLVVTALTTLCLLVIAIVRKTEEGSNRFEFR